MYTKRSKSKRVARTITEIHHPSQPQDLQEITQANDTDWISDSLPRNYYDQESSWEIFVLFPKASFYIRNKYAHPVLRNGGRRKFIKDTKFFGTPFRFYGNDRTVSTGL
jgi:hypothetical protein